MADYRYVYYPNGGIVLEASNTYIRIELNRITRYLFGEGGSVNQVFNCGVGAFIKFQSKPELNKRRALLTTQVWRYCKKNNIPITEKIFPRKDRQLEFIEDFKKVVDALEIYKSRPVL